MAEVENTLEEMINLSFFMDDGEQQHHWISKDAENLATYRGMQSRQEEIYQLMEKLESSENVKGQNQTDLGPLTESENSMKGEEGTENSSDSMNSLTAI